MIKHIDIHKALKIILGINYRFHWLDVHITPMVTTWYAAVQFRNDPKRRWNPRIIRFYPNTSIVTILEHWNAQPLVVQAETIIMMAETRAQSPTPPIA